MLDSNIFHPLLAPSLSPAPPQYLCFFFPFTLPSSLTGFLTSSLYCQPLPQALLTSLNCLSCWQDSNLDNLSSSRTREAPPPLRPRLFLQEALGGQHLNNQPVSQLFLSFQSPKWFSLCCPCTLWEAARDPRKVYGEQLFSWEDADFTLFPPLSWPLRPKES